MITFRKCLTLLPLLLAGCVSAQATMLRPEAYAPVPEHGVRLYLLESEVPATCERIALIHTEGDADITSETQMISAARRRAGKVGANALLLNNVRDPSTGTRVASAVFGVPANRKGQMIGLRCVDAAAPAVTAAGVDR
jgi:hypothetical protein